MIVVVQVKTVEVSQGVGTPNHQEGSCKRICTFPYTEETMEFMTSPAQVRLYDAAKGDWCWYDCLVYPDLRNREGLDFIMIPDENGDSRRVLPTQLRTWEE